MDGCACAELSVILATPDSYETIRETIRYLRAQTVREQLEIVIVAPTSEGLGLRSGELDGFWGVRVVEAGPIRSAAGAYAAGIRAASAPVVVLAEDHSFPEPAWAAALIAAHRQPWAVVGPVVANANPRSAIGWADHLIAYGPWSEPAAAGVVEHLPGHNSAYKRPLLLQYGPQLEAMLEAESVLHGDLRAQGYQLYLEPLAKTSHLSFGFLLAWTPAQFQNGRRYAASRARIEGWSKLRRILFAGAAPLIPLVRLRRALRQALQPGRPRLPMLRVLPALIYGLSLDGVGQFIGYAFGAGKGTEQLCPHEFHRQRHVPQRQEQAPGSQ